MMSESEVREWRNQERERVSAIVNPYHRRIQSEKLYVLNMVLQED